LCTPLFTEPPPLGTLHPKIFSHKGLQNPVRSAPYFSSKGPDSRYLSVTRNVFHTDPLKASQKYWNPFSQRYTPGVKAFRQKGLVKKPALNPKFYRRDLGSPSPFVNPRKKKSGEKEFQPFKGQKPEHKVSPQKGKTLKESSRENERIGVPMGPWLLLCEI